ncbi:BTB/POZ domain-containing protein 18 [Protopterus annectens]|uniref:BTB/POZ domain-containing protein 18 n=1 Tax=Protopterus annectens TaxID=7888 RepID=UPI001CFBED07|nr:BTB/POZ domain-containing protein 18 [Protopterus annectens]
MAAMYSRPLVYRSLRLHRITILNLQKQQQLGNFCDVILYAEGTGVPAHQCILSAVSPYFQSQFSTLHSQSEKNISMELQGIKLKTLKMLLEFIYTSEVVVFREEVVELLNAAKYFQIEELEAVELDGTKLTKVHLGKRINRDCFRAACGSSISAHFLHPSLENTTGLLKRHTELSQASNLKHDEERMCIGRSNSTEQETLVCKVTAEGKEEKLVENVSLSTAMEIVVSDQGSVTDLSAVQSGSESSDPAKSMNLLLPKSPLPKHSESQVPVAVKYSLPNTDCLFSLPASSVCSSPEEKCISILECSIPRHLETHTDIISSLSASVTDEGRSPEGNLISNVTGNPSKNATLMDHQSKPDKIKEETVKDKTHAANNDTQCDTREPRKIKISRFCLKSFKDNVFSERLSSSENAVDNRTLTRGRRWRTTLRTDWQEERLPSSSKHYTSCESNEYINRSISFPMPKIFKGTTLYNEITQPVCSLRNDRNSEETEIYPKKLKVEQYAECDHVSLDHLQTVMCEGILGVLNSTKVCSSLHTTENTPKEESVAGGEPFTVETAEIFTPPFGSSTEISLKEYTVCCPEDPIMTVNECTDSSSQSVDKLSECIKEVDNLINNCKEANKTCQHSSFTSKTEDHTAANNPHSATSDTETLPHSVVTQKQTSSDSCSTVCCVDVWQDNVADVLNTNAPLVTGNVDDLDESSIESNSTDTIMEEIDKLLDVIDKPLDTTGENSLSTAAGSHIKPEDLNQFVTHTFGSQDTQTRGEGVIAKKPDKKDIAVELCESSQVHTTITGEENSLWVPSCINKATDSLPAALNHHKESESYRGHSKNKAFDSLPVEHFLCNTDIQVEDDVMKKSFMDILDQSRVSDTNFQLSPYSEMPSKTGCGNLGARLTLKETQFFIKANELLCQAESVGEGILSCQVKNKKSNADVEQETAGLCSELQFQEHIDLTQNSGKKAKLLIADEAKQSEVSSCLCNNSHSHVMVCQPREGKPNSSTVTSPAGSLLKREGLPCKSVCSTVKIDGRSPRQVQTTATLGSENYLETLSVPSVDPVPIPKGDQCMLTAYPVMQNLPHNQMNATKSCVLDCVEVESLKQLAATVANFNTQTSCLPHLCGSCWKEKSEQVPGTRAIAELGSTSLADVLNHKAVFNKASEARAGEGKVKSYLRGKANQGINIFADFTNANLGNAVQTCITDKENVIKSIAGSSKDLRNMTASLHVTEFMNSSLPLVTTCCNLDISGSSVNSSDSDEVDILGGCEAEIEYIPVWPDPSSESETEFIVVD